MLFPPLAVHAAEPVVPGAGSILQQTQPVMPPAPSASGTGLAIEQPGGGTLPPSALFLVKAIQLSGNTAFDTPTLHALIAEAEGESLTLPQLGRFAGRISDYYHSHGYPLDRAIIPAQTMKDGMVRFVIIEARYGQIALDNRSRVVDPLLQATLAPLQSGQAISDASLNHALLLLSDVPGVAVVATLKPGETAGTSDLQVRTDPTPALTGNAAVDNDGNRYTGRARLGGTVSVIDPMQHGDTLRLSGLTSGDMDYGGVSYDWLLNGQGTRLGGSYSALHYTSWAIASLRSMATAARRSRASGSSSRSCARQPSISTGSSNTTTSSSTMRSARVICTPTAIWTMGRRAWPGMCAMGCCPAALISGAWTGPQGASALTMRVRAYDMGAPSADGGILASAEWRHELGVFWYGQMQAVGFGDREHVTINYTVWAAGPNTATLSDAGVGLNWNWSDQWNAKASIATPLGPTPTLIGTNNSARIWFALSKGF
jgi:hemolysin activation/secretion protein